MECETGKYIDSLSVENIPWHRMITAYGTAEKYGELLKTLARTADAYQWKQSFDEISDFEHQDTMFPSAPFALVFLVRILERRLNDNAQANEIIIKYLLDQFSDYIEICNYADTLPHAQPVSRFSDMLDEKYLLPEGIDAEGIEELFEEPDVIPDDLFYSCYYYSKIVLSHVPGILDKYQKYEKENSQLKDMLLSGG